MTYNVFGGTLSLTQSINHSGKAAGKLLLSLSQQRRDIIAIKHIHTYISVGYYSSQNEAAIVPQNIANTAALSGPITPPDLVIDVKSNHKLLARTRRRCDELSHRQKLGTQYFSPIIVFSLLN